MRNNAKRAGRRRGAGMPGGFFDQLCGIATAQAGAAIVSCSRGRPRAQWSIRNRRIAGQRRYLTSFSGGSRREPCGDFGSPCAGGSSGAIASHKAFNSESAILLSFIRSSRIATDTNSAVCRSLSISAARHSSSVARTERSRSSELATSVFSVTELAR
jgi:hypothetical protein